MDNFQLVREIEPHGALRHLVIGNIRSYRNDLYTVSVTHKKLLEGSVLPSILHLVVSRIDGEPVSSWSHMQTIKNELIGPEFTGVEVFPPESMLTDAANCYHIWVHPDVNFRLPFSLNPARVVVPN